MKLWLHDNESWDEIVLDHVPPPLEKYDHRQESNGTRYEVATSFHIWKLGQTYRTLRAETTRMHTIPARLSPPPRTTTNPHALQKGHAHHMPITARPCTPSTHHYDYDYTACEVCRCPRAYHSLYCDHQSFICPTDEKASMHLLCPTILSYQVKFFWSMTNPVPSSDNSDDETIRPNDNPPALRSRKIYISGHRLRKSRVSFNTTADRLWQGITHPL